MARMSDAEMLLWMKNLIDVAKNSPATFGLIAAQIDEVTNFYETLKAAVEKRETSEIAYRADVVAQQTARASADPFVSFLTATVKKNPAVSDADKVALGIEPNKPPTSTPPVAPASITANGYENGINVIRWERSGNKQSTQFILEYREAGEAEFKYLATTTDTVFSHTGVKPGVKYAYRVKAQRAGQESTYSGVAVVYMT